MEVTFFVGHIVPGKVQSTQICYITIKSTLKEGQRTILVAKYHCGEKDVNTRKTDPSTSQAPGMPYTQRRTIGM